MKDTILNLEEDFSNNEYFGTNVWTEEKFRILNGNTSVLLSAPHSVNQIRGEDVRDAEKYTGSLVRCLSRATNSYGIFQLFTHADPNYDNEHNYKTAVINLIEQNNIKFLIDIHSSEFKDDCDIDLVTNNRQSLCGSYEIISIINDIANKNHIKVDEKNSPNKDCENEIIGICSNLCGIPSIRIVINNKKLDPDNDNNNIENIYKTIEDFILQINSLK